jgi:hypothetical protein
MTERMPLPGFLRVHEGWCLKRGLGWIVSRQDGLEHTRASQQHINEDPADPRHACRELRAGRGRVCAI